VSNVYPNGLPAASELDLDVAEGKLMVLVRPSGSGKTTALRMVTDLGGHHLRDALDRREGGQQPAPQGPQGGQRLGTSDSWEHGFHQDFPIPTKLPSPRRYDRDMPPLTRKPCNKHARDQGAGESPVRDEVPKFSCRSAQAASAGSMLTRYGHRDRSSVPRPCPWLVLSGLGSDVGRRGSPGGASFRWNLTLVLKATVLCSRGPPRLTSPRAQDTSEYPTSPGDEAQFPLLASVAPRQGD
jgi:energy-coupling factor transporter ATP-binding protein EcfA2